jgi:hypothetical protein
MLKRPRVFEGPDLSLVKNLECEERSLQAKKPVHCKRAKVAENLFVDTFRTCRSSDAEALPWLDQML